MCNNFLCTDCSQQLWLINGDLNIICPGCIETATESNNIIKIISRTRFVRNIRIDTTNLIRMKIRIIKMNSAAV